MKTALSLAAVLALGCASTALAQSDRYGSQYDQQSGQYGSKDQNIQDQNSKDQTGQYGSQNDQYQNDQNPNGANGQTSPGYGNEPNDQYNQDQNGQYNENTPGQYNDQQNNENNDESGMVPTNLDRDDVRRLQLTLRHEGYDPGRADGSWGQQTASALADFQRANGIEPTGNLDKRTVRALGLPPDESYGGARDNDRDGQYGNELNNPDMNDNPDTNSPDTNKQNPDDSDQDNPH